MPVTSPARQIPPAQPIHPTTAKLGLPETTPVMASDPFPGSELPTAAAVGGPTAAVGGPTAAVEREILGTIDIGFGLPENAWDQIPSAIPSAMAERPSWERRTALDQATPKARPGYVQRWVRIATADGRPDVSNKAEALMTGWRPRRAQTLADSEVGMPVYDPGDGKGGVMIFKEQLLLCEMPVEMHRRLEAAMASERDAINRTIYQEARKANGMPEKYATLDYDTGRDSAALID